MENIKNKGLEEIKELAIDYLKNEPSSYACDLHGEVYNSDYFIVGRYQAEQWLSENYGVFQAIDKIKEYEEENFGEVHTDLSEPEKIVNMLVYIIGEEVLQESETLSEVWDSILEPEDCKKIIEEIE